MWSVICDHSTHSDPLSSSSASSLSSPLWSVISVISDLPYVICDLWSFHPQWYCTVFINCILVVVICYLWHVNCDLWSMICDHSTHSDPLSSSVASSSSPSVIRDLLYVISDLWYVLCPHWSTIFINSHCRHLWSDQWLQWSQSQWSSLTVVDKWLL